MVFCGLPWYLPMAVSMRWSLDQLLVVICHGRAISHVAPRYPTKRKLGLGELFPIIKTSESQFITMSHQWSTMIDHWKMKPLLTKKFSTIRNPYISNVAECCVSFGSHVHQSCKVLFHDARYQQWRFTYCDIEYRHDTWVHNHFPQMNVWMPPP